LLAIEPQNTKRSNTYDELVEALLGEGPGEKEAAKQKKSRGAAHLHDT
jgi:hypothetical protein